jgi:hypothetical protein
MKEIVLNFISRGYVLQTPVSFVLFLTSSLFESLGEGEVASITPLPSFGGLYDQTTNIVVGLSTIIMRKLWIITILYYRLYYWHKINHM